MLKDTNNSLQMMENHMKMDIAMQSNVRAKFTFLSESFGSVASNKVGNCPSV